MSVPAPLQSAYIAHPHPLRRMNPRVALALLALFIFSLGLNVYRNAFPYFYHPDEPNKVRQLLEDTRNYNHPLFMLEVAEGVSRVLQTPRQPQDIVELGRWLSAVYLAIAAVGAAWLIWQWWGALAAGIAGVLFALAPDVIELSHYFKEDAALTMGLALFFVSALLWEARGGWKRVVLLGCAAGVCASAKYVGAVALPLGLALITWRGLSIGARQPGHLAAQLGAFLATAVLAFAMINLPLITNLDAALKSLDRETQLATKGQAGLRKDLPHSGIVERFGQRTGVLLPFYLCGWWIFWRARRDRKRARTEWLYLAFPLLLTLILSFSAKDSGRYFLPAILGITGLGAAGLAWALTRLWERRRIWTRVLAVALAVLVAGGALERAYKYLNGFHRDGRTELMAVLSERTPADAVILQGNKVFLPAPDHRYTDAWRIESPREIRTCKIIADEAATPADLRTKGFTHVIINVSEYGRYLSEDQRPSKEIKEDYDRRRRFYTELLAQGNLLFESAEGKIGTHNPDLRLYELPPAP